MSELDHDPILQMLLALRADVDSLMAREVPNQNLDTASDVTFDALNVGTATSAAAGTIRASGALYPGPAAGTGATGVASERHILAAAGIDQIFNGTSFGTLFVHDQSNGAIAIYELRGGVHATAEIADPHGVFTATKASATSINIYWDTTAYFIQNTNAGSHTVDLMLLGAP